MITRNVRHRQAGLTLIELMVSLVVAAIAVGFIFRIYATTAVAYRSQAQIAEVQQTLRTAKQLIANDLRMAGYFSSGVKTAAGITLTPVSVTNSASGPDELRVIWADTSCLAYVDADEGPNFHSAETQVTDSSCFAEGDIIMAVRLRGGTNAAGDYVPKGTGCTLYATKVHIAGGKHRIQHNPGQGAPWNGPGNSQCDPMNGVWDDGYTAFLRFKARAYRIKPDDNRGVLQVSESGGTINDWQDVALGFLDMQIALLTYDENSLTDEDELPGPDGTMSNKFDWMSGDNMESDDLVNPTTAKDIVQVRLTLVARTTAEIEGVSTSTTPNLLGDPDKPNDNPIGDRPAIDLTALNDPSSTDYAPDSPYFGQYAFRSVSTVVDLRNLGVGIEQ